ncbi:unnamed protein product [Ciceribacter sp. T2.26MG-112.2]|nr:unnamed protein product [Ciceribacter naphthalenivorans]
MPERLGIAAPTSRESGTRVRGARCCVSPKWSLDELVQAQAVDFRVIHR